MAFHRPTLERIHKNTQMKMTKRLVKILNKIGLHALFLLACTLFAYMILMFVLTLMGVFS